MSENSQAQAGEEVQADISNINKEPEKVSLDEYENSVVGDGEVGQKNTLFTETIVAPSTPSSTSTYNINLTPISNNSVESSPSGDSVLQPSPETTKSLREAVTTQLNACSPVTDSTHSTPDLSRGSQSSQSNKSMIEYSPGTHASSYEAASPSPSPASTSTNRTRSSSGSTNGSLLRQIGRASISPQSEASNSPEGSFVIVTSSNHSPTPVIRPQASTSNVSLSGSLSSEIPLLVRPRAHSAIIPRHPSTKSKLVSSSDGQSIRNRASIPSIALSPIPDLQDDSVFDQSGNLDPGASTFNPNAHMWLGKHVNFEYIVLNGKNEFGDLIHEARVALQRLGLRPIPAMHGPTSLPYARCPSGIDAFLFSPHKGDDPYTFILEPDTRKGSKPGRPIVTPLPGNARYSQATHISNARGKSRVVSAPEMIDERKEKIFSSNRPRFVSGGLDRDFSNTSTYGDEDSSTTVSNLYVDSQDYYGDPQVQYRESWSNDLASQQLEVPSSNFDQESYISTTALPSPAYPTSHHYVQPPYSYPWPAYSNPYYAGYAPAPTAATYYNPAQAQSQIYAAAQARIPMITPSYVNDSAAISYAYQQQQQQQQYHQHLQNQYQVEDESESFQTAYEGEETEEEEIQQGGFFFPAVAPQSRGQYRRDSTSSVTTTVPQMIITTPRKRSVVGPAKVGFENQHYHQERRNSASAAVPNLQRRKSIPNAPVTVSPPRRFSIATPLNHSNQHQYHQSDTKILRQPRNPPPPPQSPPLAPLPPTPYPTHVSTHSNTQQNLVPHRNRPQSTSSANVAPQSTTKSHSRNNSKSASTSANPQSQLHNTHLNKLSSAASKGSVARSGNSSGDWGKEFVEENVSVIEEEQARLGVGSSNTSANNNNTWYRGRGRGRRGRGRSNEKVEKAV